MTRITGTLAIALTLLVADGRALHAGIATDAPPVVSGAGVLVYDRDYPFIRYSDPPVHNEIARLRQRIINGTTTLEPTPEHGYLESVLAALHINPDSQALVFSKTSLQVDAISAATPRAIYFNDDTYVAWVQTTGILELVTMDADLGPVFYTLSAADSRPDLNRQTLRCLTCHDSFAEMGGGVPHFLFESIYELQGNKLIPDAVSRETSIETPIAQRWGGWYVTGNDGGALHLGNILPPLARSPVNIDKVRRGSLQSLDGLFDTGRYLRATSDIVALLVLDHQVSLHNAIIHANYKSRFVLNRMQPGTDAATVTWSQLPAPLQLRLDLLLRPLVDALLMIHAAPLPDKVVGNTGYAAWFQDQGPKDPRGRSLRQLDLASRVFRYPLSFLIYSEGFDALPLFAREHVYAQLAQILRAAGPAAPSGSGSAADRQAAFDILLATKPEFARFVSASNP
ncbi:MAG: hypothetical protein WDM77_18630 [Steroidobacteraceae bacterium]